MFVFITNMNTISATNFSNINSINRANSVNRTLPRKNISFGDGVDTFVISQDDFIALAQQMTSGLIYAYSKRGEYHHAAEMLRRSNGNFDPNFVVDGADESLIDAIYNPVYIGKIKALLHRNDRKKLLVNIILHDDFSNKDRDYLDFAIKHNDTFLVAILCKKFGKELDKTDSNFESYIAKTKNKVIIQLLKECSQMEVKPPEKEQRTEEIIRENSVGEEMYEEDDIKKFRVRIPDSVPSSLDDIGGLKEAKEEIKDFIIKPWSKGIREELKANNVEMPNGFLMYGPPGCGKTFVAKVIAKQTGYPMYELDLSSVGDARAYGTEKTLRRIFEALESQYQKNNIPNILFLDEIDSIAASRGKSSTDWKRDEINCLISLANQVAEKGIILIGATNYIDNIDNAIMRTGRFDKKIEISLPDFDERKEILTKLSSMKKIALSLLPLADEMAKCTDGKSCSDLNAIINTCCRQAIYAKKKSVSIDDFQEAVEKVEDAKNERKPIGFHR